MLLVYKKHHQYNMKKVGKEMIYMLTLRMLPKLFVYLCSAA